MESVLNRLGDPAPDDTPLDNKQLTERVRQQDEVIRRQGGLIQVLSNWLIAAFVVIIVVSLVSMVSIFKSAGRAPKATEGFASIGLVRTLAGEITSVQSHMTSTDSLAKVTRADAADAKAKAAYAVEHTDDYGHRVDEIWKSQRHDEINDVEPKK